MLARSKKDILLPKECLTMNDLTNLTLTQTLQALKNKQFSEEELNNGYFNRIDLLNPKLNVFLEAKKNTQGIPKAIKDIICTQNIKTTAGSEILNNFIPQYNATVVTKLLSKNCSVVGKTNCDEFAMGSSGENSAFGPTLNPWDQTKVPGGSSSGSAAAVAADLSVFAIGSDTGGSIRQPASFCGVVGFKPSYGKISRYGFISMASSLDCPGTFTKTVVDAKLVLEWLEGPDGYDSNVVEAGTKQQALGISKGIKDLKIGVPKEYFGKGLNEGVEKVVREAISKLEELGAQVVEVSLPHTEYAVATYYIIMASEVSSNLARFDWIRYGQDRSKFGAEPKRRIIL